MDCNTIPIKIRQCATKNGDFFQTSITSSTSMIKTWNRHRVLLAIPHDLSASPKFGALHMVSIKTMRNQDYQTNISQG